MVADDNFTNVFHGKPFQRWRAKNRQAVRALEQIDLTTRDSLLDKPVKQAAMYSESWLALACRDSIIDGRDFVRVLRRQFAEQSADELLELLGQAVESVARNETPRTFAASLGLLHGVSGYVYHTVPVAIHAWLGHQQDFREAIMAVVRCGGDTDSTAAIVGGIVGCSVGKEGIPAEWLQRLCEWPRTISWMERAAEQLHEVEVGGRPTRPLGLSPFGILARNSFFLGVVLTHGCRRLLPPY